TGNEMVYSLSECQRLCLELAEKGYKFDGTQLDAYLNKIEESKARYFRRTHNTLGFEDKSWKEMNKPRHFVLGYTAHGFHFRLRSNAAFHRPEVGCVCKRCGESASSIDHLQSCVGFDTSDLFRRYTATGA